MKHRTIIVFAATAAVAGIVALAGCAPQTESASSGAQTLESESSQQGTTATWSPDADCSTCHAKEASSTGTAGCLAQTHASQGYSCTDCHADEQSLATAHGQNVSGTPAAKLKTTDVGDAACLACHDSREAIAVQTADTVLSDDKGTTVNPHELPPSADHDALECMSCHVSHEAKPALEEAQGICASCHHAGVFECGTCHT